jgi:hypothetical protein
MCPLNLVSALDKVLVKIEVLWLVILVVVAVGRIQRAGSPDLFLCLVDFTLFPSQFGLRGSRSKFDPTSSHVSHRLWFPDQPQGWQYIWPRTFAQFTLRLLLAPKPGTCL